MIPNEIHRIEFKCMMSNEWELLEYVYTSYHDAVVMMTEDVYPGRGRIISYDHNTGAHGTSFYATCTPPYYTRG